MKVLAQLATLFILIHFPLFAKAQDTSILKYEVKKDNRIGYFYDINGNLIDGELDHSYEPQDLLLIKQKLGTQKASLSKEEIIDQFDHFIFYRELGKNMNGDPVYRYFLKDKRVAEEIRLGSQNGFDGKKNRIHELLLSSFDEYQLPKVIQESQKLSINHIYFIAKLLKYEWLYRENKSIFLDKDWNPAESEAEMAYYIKVDSIVGGNIFLSNHRRNHSIVNSFSISDQYPDMQVGWDYYYWENGKLKKALFYQEDLLDSIKTYRSNGQLFEVIKARGSKTSYVKVFNKEGSNLLDKKYNGIASLYDSIQQREIVKEYKNGSLAAAYFLEEGKRNYLYSEEALSYRFFNKFFDQFKNSLKTSKEDSVLADGLSLLHVLVNEKGELSEVEFLKSVNPELDDAILNFFQEVNGKKVFNLASYEGKPVAQHVLIPIEYYSFYRKKFKWTWGSFNSFYMFSPSYFAY